MKVKIVRKILCGWLVLTLFFSANSFPAMADDMKAQAGIYGEEQNQENGGNESQENNSTQSGETDYEERITADAVETGTPKDEMTDNISVQNKNEDGAEQIKEQTEEQAEETEEGEVSVQDDISSANFAVFSADRSVTYDVNFDDSVLPESPGTGKNEWQIMRGGYIGPYDQSNVSETFDSRANVSYSTDNAVRLTKNIISTDVENEFLMYLNVEPQVSWEDVLQLNTIKVSNNNRQIRPPQWPEGGRNSSYFVPEPQGEYQTPVQFRYYAMENGEKHILAELIMYTNVTKVPNGAVGIGNPLLAPEGESFYATNNFDIKSNGNGVSVAEIDITTIYEKYEFSYQKVYPKSVSDQVGNHLRLDETSFNYDGGSCQFSNEVIEWTLPDKDLGLLPYKIDAQGNVSPSGVLRKLDSGKSTYYRQEAYQMTYRFSLLVQDENYVSAGSAESANDNINAEYAVQTNKSPGSQGDKEKGGVVNYAVGDKNGTGDFKSPYIKGLLYDLEFQKVIAGSKVPLEGITFKIERVSGSGTYSEEIRYSYEDATDSEGWLKFHDLLWGTYKITEVSYKNGDTFQNNYLMETLPKEIETVQIGEVINRDALRNDHASPHSMDREKDLKNQLFLLNNGTVENGSCSAKVQIKKAVEGYDTLPDELKNQKYTMKITSQDVYLKPTTDQTQVELFNKSDSIGHQEVLTYDINVPENGGNFTLEELISDAVSQKIAFSKVEIEKNAGSTEIGKTITNKQGCSVTIKPGNDITITVVNRKKPSITFQKRDSGNSKNLLKGVYFALYQSSNGSEDMDISQWIKDEIACDDLVTDANGEIKLEYLDTGAYILEEIKAVDGFMLPEKPCAYIIVTGEGKIVVKSGDGSVFEKVDTYKENSIYQDKYQITNCRLYQLPDTGGPGTYLFTVSGVVLLTAALLILIKRINERRAL